MFGNTCIAWHASTSGKVTWGERWLNVGQEHAHQPQLEADNPHPAAAAPSRIWHGRQHAPAHLGCQEDELQLGVLLQRRAREHVRARKGTQQGGALQ